MALAYPDSAHSKLGQVIARNHFISALGDREMELKVRDRDPDDLESAFKAAIRIETHLKAYEVEHEREMPRDNRNRRERYDDQRVRQVVPPSDRTVGDIKAGESAVAKLCAQLERSQAQFERCQREKDELHKELGRLKLLAEQARQPLPVTSSVAQPGTQVAAPAGDMRPNQGAGHGSRFQFTNPRPAGSCFSCGSRDHYARACPNRAPAPVKRQHEERPQGNAGPSSG